jgi:hypothetical protein
MGGLMDGWMEVKAVLRIAYSNRKRKKIVAKEQKKIIEKLKKS